jgi:hypothetical protein
MEITNSLKLRKTYRLIEKGSFREDSLSRGNSADISARCRRIGIESSLAASLKRGVVAWSAGETGKGGVLAPLGKGGVMKDAKE